MYALTCVSLKTMQTAPLPKATVLALGNFDGVHVAHRALMQKAVELRERECRDAAVGVFCFRVPSSDYLFADPPAHLCTLEEKLLRARDCGMEYAILADFSALRDLPPDAFCHDVLFRDAHCVGAVCGYNYRYGKGGKGTPETLAASALFPLTVLPSVHAGGLPVSSTRIRELLLAGDAGTAAELLGSPYSLTAKVVHGNRIGSEIGFPTLNQHFPEGRLIPRHGVYESSCRLPDGRTYRGISNVGLRPTVSNEGSVNCETHLIDFSDELYGQTVTVSFLRYLREEKKFSDLDELREQIRTDLLSFTE